MVPAGSRPPPRPPAGLAGAPSQRLRGQLVRECDSLSGHSRWQQKCHPLLQRWPVAAFEQPDFRLNGKQIGPFDVELKWPLSSLGMGPDLSCPCCARC